MRSTLRTPTNINIDGKALDAYSKIAYLSYTVNCDSQSWVSIDYRDMTDGRIFGKSYPRNGTMIAAHNGDTWRGQLHDFEDGASPFTLGHDFSAEMTVYQNYPESSEHPLNTGEGKYDVYIGAGRIRQAGNSSKAYIDQDITCIKVPVRYSSRLIGGCLLKVGSAYALIESYDPDTGECDLTSISVPSGSALGETTAGQLYQLISNYIQCDPFYFLCRSDPTVNLTHQIDEYGLTVMGEYSQQQEVSMQSYRFTLEGEGMKDQTEASYTYTFSHTFPRLCVPQTLTCEIVTQEDFEGEFTHPITETGSQTSLLSLSAEWRGIQGIRLTVTDDLSADAYFVWRKTGDSFTFVGRFQPDSPQWSLTDYLAGANREISYLISAVKGDREYFAQSDTVMGASRQYYIAALTDNGTHYGSKRFQLGESFTFTCDISSSAIESVRDKALYKTQSTYPVSLGGSSLYQQGSFEAILGTVEKIEQTADEISAWTDFITSHEKYLLKTDSGDVFIVTITDNPSRTYGSAAELGITRIRYGWAQCEDTSRAVIS